jgi:hypothetical protein
MSAMLVNCVDNCARVLLLDLAHHGWCNVRLSGGLRAGPFLVLEFERPLVGEEQFSLSRRSEVVAVDIYRRELVPPLMTPDEIEQQTELDNETEQAIGGHHADTVDQVQ